MIRRICCILLLLLGLAPWAEVQAKTRCVALFQAKKLMAAARCFEALARSFPKARLSEKQMVSKGRALRNAATVWSRLARLQKRVERAAYMRERALALMRTYVAQKLYEVKHRKRSALLTIQRLRQQIGYAPLTVVSGHKEAQIELKGYQFRERAKGTWSDNVRPGPYTIAFAYPGQKKPMVKQIQVQPSKPYVLTLQAPSPKKPKSRLAARQPPRRPPAPKAKPAPVAAIALLAGGAAVLIGGAVFLGLAGAADSRKQTLHQKLTRGQGSGADTDQLLEAHQRATLLFPVGWIVLGAGAAIAATGGILLALR